jgi:hypothetical protein
LEGRTVDGSCVVVVNLGKVDLDSYYAENYIDCVLYVLDTLLQQNPADRWVVVSDMASVTISSAPAKVPPTKDLKRAIDIFQARYPDRLERMFLIGCPQGLRTMWGLVEQFIEEDVRLKLEFSAEKESKRLLHYIDAGQLELKFGGKAPTQTVFWPVSVPRVHTGLGTTASGPLIDLNSDRPFIPTYSMASSIDNVSKIEFDPYQIQDIQLPPVDCVSPQSPSDPASKLKLKFESIASGEENRASLMHELELEGREQVAACSCRDGFLEFCIIS